MFDVLVIGGGPGGYAASIRASQLGGKVALVEAAEIGGTCVNRGCIPTKVWLKAASVIHGIQQGKQFGVNASLGEMDFQKLLEWRNGASHDTRMGMEGILRSNDIEIIRGRAVLESSSEIVVDNTLFKANRIIIATGSSFAVPEVPGLKKAMMTTDEVLNMREVPASVLILGGGFIELEMAYLLNIFGCKVQIAAGPNGILTTEDRTPRQWVTKGLKELGVEIFRKHTLESVNRSNTGHEVVLSGPDKKTLEVEKVLVASRKPNTENLGLQGTGILLNADGGIQIDNQLKTSIEGIYAIGDATGGRMLAHGASSMGIIAAENAMGKKEVFPFQLVPRGLWTVPEIGAVGLTEKEVKKKGIDFKVGEFPYSVNGLAVARSQMEGSVKIISDARYGEILGVHIAGTGATELIGEAVLAMQLEATPRQLAYSIRVHPSFSENISDAARDIGEWGLYLPKK